MRDFEKELKNYKLAFGIIAVMSATFLAGLLIAKNVVIDESSDYTVNWVDNENGTRTKIVTYVNFYDPTSTTKELDYPAAGSGALMVVFGLLWILADVREFNCANCSHHKRRHIDKSGKPFDECQFKNCSCKEFK